MKFLDIVKKNFFFNCIGGLVERWNKFTKVRNIVWIWRLKQVLELFPQGHLLTLHPKAWLSIGCTGLEVLKVGEGLQDKTRCQILCVAGKNISEWGSGITTSLLALNTVEKRRKSCKEFLTTSFNTFEARIHITCVA